LAKNGQKMAPC